MSRSSTLALLVVLAPLAAAQLPRPIPPILENIDTDGDGLPDWRDDCPTVGYRPGFDGTTCGPLDGDPNNDPQPECKARERVFHLLQSDPKFVTHIAFSVVKNGEVHFADAFAYLGGGQYVHDPAGIHRLFRIGSTSKSVTAVAAKVLEESGVLAFDDWVSDDDGSRVLVGGQVTLGELLGHRNAFSLDVGALHLYCYPGDLAEFWAEPDDAISPHYDSATYGNLGGGYEYSAFNYSLAGAHLANRAGAPFGEVVQGLVFDPAGMCTASTDGARAVTTAIGYEWAVSEAAVMHVGPYINLFSQSDPLCEDNFYSSDDLPGDPYSWQLYHLDEADSQARDPAGGVIASVVDLAHFARSLLASYHGTGGLLSQAGVRDLWAATSDLGCAPNCAYERYYATGFFTDSLPNQPVHQVGHGGSRPGYASAFVLRPEANLAVAILVNADVSTVTLSDLAKTILDDFE